jgi:tripartite-type tricarboxylate transporter receptor subunit TctC
VKSPPDGYTILLVNPAHGINPTLYKDLPYNVLRDIAPVAGLVRAPNVMEVTNSFPAKTVQEFIDYCKANPGKINFASSGSGTSVHMSGELFMLMTGCKMLHVPYKGAGPAIADLIPGQVHVLFDNLPSSIGHIKGGRLRALAVAAPKRDPQLPDVPTTKEAGVDRVEVSVWYGLFAPAGTPKEIVQALATAVVRATRDPESRRKLIEQGADPVGSTPEAFASLMREEVARWAEVVKVSGAQAD